MPREYYQANNFDELNQVLTDVSHRLGQIRPDGSIEYNVIGGWVVGNTIIYASEPRGSTQHPNDGIFLDSEDRTLRVYEGTNLRVEVGNLKPDSSSRAYGIKVYDSSGVVLLEASEEQNKVGGWTLTTGTLTNSSVTLAATGALYIKSSTYGDLGAQLEYNDGEPRLYVGDGAFNYLNYSSASGTKVGVGPVGNLTLQPGADIILYGDPSDPAAIQFPCTGDTTVTYQIGAESTGPYFGLWTGSSTGFSGDGVVAFGFSPLYGGVTYLRSFFSYATSRTFLQSYDSTTDHGASLDLAATSGKATLTADQINLSADSALLTLNSVNAGGLNVRCFKCTVNPSSQTIIAPSGTWGMFMGNGQSTGSSLNCRALGMWYPTASTCFMVSNNNWAGSTTGSYIGLHATGGNFVLEGLHGTVGFNLILTVWYSA